MVKCWLKEGDIMWVINHVNVYRTFSKRFEYGAVAIQGDHFYRFVNDINELDIDEMTTIIDGHNCYMVPGLIDIHMHIESSMTLPGPFSAKVLEYGVTTVVADPHELANVFGLEGIQLYLDMPTVMDVYFGIPSSVPSTSFDYETSGGAISDNDVVELLKHPKIRCLGEVMNYFDVIDPSGQTMIQKIIKTVKTIRPDMPLEAHCPSVSGNQLAAFMASGINADHTLQTPDSIIEKVENNMFLEVQEKVITPENIKTILDHHYEEYMALVTDDVSVDRLLNHHLDGVILKAVQAGMPMEIAIYCATYTPARRMHFVDRGAIAPGLKADFILLDDLDHWKVNRVYKNGMLMVQPSKSIYPHIPGCTVDQRYRHSIDHALMQPSDFVLQCDQQTVVANVIGINGSTNATSWEKVELAVHEGIVDYQSAGLSLLACIERHGNDGHYALGLVKNAFDKQGAVAASLAHDHHNLLVLGNDANDMAKAVNDVIKMQGGFNVVSHGQTMASLALTIGGIVSDAPIESIAHDLSNVRTAMERLGYHHHNNIMSLTTLGLPVSYHLRLTDKGLIDVSKREFVPLFD